MRIECKPTDPEDLEVDISGEQPPALVESELLSLLSDEAKLAFEAAGSGSGFISFMSETSVSEPLSRDT